MPRMTASEAMVETLRVEGVEVVKGIVGSAFMDLLDLFPDAGIRFVPVRHEQSCGHMADAYSRVTGKAGVCIGQNGPGMTNMVTSVAAANHGHSPIVVIGPSAGSPTVGWDGFQEADQVSIFESITKASIRVPHPSRAADCLRTAFRIAYAERGAVYVDVPRDYFYGEVNEDILRPEQYRVSMRGAGDEESLERAADILTAAEFPVILSGKGTVEADAIEDVRELAEYLSAPVACSYLHNDAFPANHPQAVGPIGYMGSKAAMRCLAKADVILAVGTRLSVFGTLPQYDIDYMPKTARIIQIDVNPRQLGRVHPIEVGIIGDARAAVREITRRVKARNPERLPAEERLAFIREQNERWQKEIFAAAMVDGNPINPRRALMEIADAMPEDAIVATDIGNVSSTANSYLKFVQGRKHIAALTFGNTGFAYPAAMGAKLGRPDCPVVAIIGDGAWGMSLHEVSTAVEENIPVVACVFNNRSWGAEKKNQIDFYCDRYVGVDIDGPSFATVAEAMGAQGVRIDRPQDIKEAFLNALRSDRPTVLELMVDGTQLAPPFRKDALKLPVRYLERYRHLTHPEISG